KELWKRAKEQLPSVQKLLAEYKDDVDVFEVPVEEGVQQVSWGLKKIARLLLERRFVVEIALDATYNMNALHLELYCVLSEHDGEGFPLSYCLLSTATAISPQKHTNALKNWTTHL
ncbi:hypothetical protein Moror_7640, partial [Moniliophthora roreri MCA 2997]